MDPHRLFLEQGLDALESQGLLDVPSLSALLADLSRRVVAAARACERERLLVSLQQETIAVLRSRHLGRPLQEWRDGYEFALRAVARALEPAPASTTELRERSGLDVRSFLPPTPLETLTAVACSGWYSLQATPLPSGPFRPGSELSQELDEWRGLAAASTLGELRRFVVDRYCADTWGALALRRPDIIPVLAQEEAGAFLRRLVARDFEERQRPAIERQILEELDLRR